MSEGKGQGGDDSKPGVSSGTEGEVFFDATIPNVNRVSIKVGPFWQDRPALWFATLEAQFHINAITKEQTKFYYAISFLDTKVADEVCDLITQPPTENPYTTLKEALISRFSESYEEKARRLLEKEEIGDRKPSSFLRHLRELAGAAFPERMLLTIWMNRLPTQTQGILLAQKQASPTELGDLADRLHEIHPGTNSNVHTVLDCKCSNSGSQITALQGQISELTRIVAGLTVHRSRSRDRFAAPRVGARSRSRSSKFCFYHNRFGKKALKCTQPCSWQNRAPQHSGNKPSSQ